MLIKTQILITQSDSKALPDKAKIVGPVNNITSSIFSSLQTRINDTLISFSPDSYHLKNYMTILMSFSEDAKNGQIRMNGWFTDSPATQGVKNDVRNIEPTSTNEGFQTRSKWFRENYNTTKPYRATGTTFIGTFRHDLHGVMTPLPPSNTILLLKLVTI